MNILEALWNYQVAELAFEEYEASLKNTETRKKLLQHQKFLQAKQQIVKNIETESMQMESKLKELSAQINKLSKNMKDKEHELNEFAESDIDDIFLEDVKETIRECEEIKAALDASKKKIVDIKHKLEKSNEEVLVTLRNMSASKKEFDRLKEIYNKEIEAGSGEIEKLKNGIKEAAKDVDPKALEEYKKIKMRWKNPIARLNGDRCQGCNMQLPSSVIGSLKSGEKITVCDSCGRILYL